MIANEPSALAAAMRSPSRAIARLVMGAADIASELRACPSGDRKWICPSEPPAAISPSGATMTALSGAARLIIAGALCPHNGQRRTVASYPALTSDLPSGAKATALMFC
jgi:hypothetical protein